MVRHGWAGVCLVMAVGAVFSPEARADEATLGTAEAAEHLILTVNGEQILHVPALARVSVGDPAVADVESLGDGKIRIVGTGEGETTLWTWTSGGVKTRYGITVKR